MKTMLIFPHRGSPPPDQEGYDRDPGDPFIFRMKWIPCQMRTTLDPCNGCWGGPRIPFCNFFDKPVEQSECLSCGGKEPERKPQIVELGLSMLVGSKAEGN